LKNGVLSNTTFEDFYWESTANNATTFGTGQDLTQIPSWVSTLQEHAFDISGTAVGSTPEPASWGLMSAGLAGLALIRRKIA
jgi:hypothetical protein